MARKSKKAVQPDFGDRINFEDLHAAVNTEANRVKLLRFAVSDVHINPSRLFDLANVAGPESTEYERLHLEGCRQCEGFLEWYRRDTR